MVQVITFYVDCASRECWQAFEALPYALQGHSCWVHYQPVALCADASVAAQQARHWLAARGVALLQGLPNRYSCELALRSVWQAADAVPLSDLPAGAQLAQAQEQLAQWTAQARNVGVEQLPCMRVGENPSLVLSLAALSNSLM